MPPSNAPVNGGTGLIQATSQQSRFHVDTLDASLEIDLKDVTVSIGGRELISASHLRLKDGVRYGFVGRNGSGKSTLLTAIAEKIIPGIGESIRILLLSQVEDNARATADETVDGGTSVLEHVVRGDKDRLRAVKKFQVLTAAVELTSLVLTERIVRTVQLEQRRSELVDAAKIAKRRSGARGKDARAEEIKAENRVKEAEQALQAVGTSDPPANVMEQAMELLTDAQATLDLLETSTTEARTAVILSGLGFSQAVMEGAYSALSGGWKSRCALAVSLLVHCDVLLLDEPTNFLDLEATIWLEQYLLTQSRTLVLVSHDQDFLDATVDETIILRNKTLRYFEGTPTAFEVEERKSRKKLIKAQEKLDIKKDHIQESIQKGIASAKKTGDENRQRMVKSRQKKLDERWGVETSSKGTRFKLNRDMGYYGFTNRNQIVIENMEPMIKISIPNPSKLRTLGDLIHFDAVSFRFPKTPAALLENVTFTVEQGGRCAFVGANGNGKSTIAKLILGTLTPTKGTITRHPLLKTGYFSQHSVEDLSVPVTASSSSAGPVTALSYFMDHFESRGEKVVEQDARSCLGSFGLQGRIASDTPLAALSGGQKVRLAFALIIFHPPPLLLLDELTTHVDAPTIQALGKALRQFTGAIIMITHDRWFSRVVIEGASPRPAAADDDEDSDDPSSEDEDVASAANGKTYLVGAGKVKLLENGMAQYVRLVEKKLTRKRKEQAGT